jgi:anti-sigma factor RsiW
MAKLPPLTDEEREKLIAYLDGELDAKTARLIETKISRDSRYRAEVESLRQTWEMLDYLPQPAASPSFSTRTLESVSALRPPPRLRLFRNPAARRWGLGLGWAAAVLLAFIAGFATVDSLSTSKRPTATPPVDLDQLLVRDHRVIENQRLYENVDDMNFLRQLDDPDLFGDDG